MIMGTYCFQCAAAICPCWVQAARCPPVILSHCPWKGCSLLCKSPARAGAGCGGCPGGSWRFAEIFEGKWVNAQTRGTVHTVPESLMFLRTKAKGEVLIILALLSVFQTQVLSPSPLGTAPMYPYGCQAASLNCSAWKKPMYFSRA